MNKSLPYDLGTNPGTMEESKIKHREALEVKRQTFWHVRRESLPGVGDRVRGAFDVKYHCTFHKLVFGYKNVEVRDYFDHLDNKLCKLDIGATKNICKEYLS